MNLVYMDVAQVGAMINQLSLGAYIVTKLILSIFLLPVLSEIACIKKANHRERINAEHQ